MKSATHGRASMPHLDTINRDGPLSALWISYRKAPINLRDTYLLIKTHKTEACGRISSPDEVSHVPLVAEIG